MNKEFQTIKCNLCGQPVAAVFDLEAEIDIECYCRDCTKSFGLFHEVIFPTRENCLTEDVVIKAFYGKEEQRGSKIAFENHKAVFHLRTDRILKRN